MRITESKLRKIIRETIKDFSHMRREQTPEEKQVQDRADFFTQEFYEYLDRDFDSADSEYYHSKYDYLEDYYQQIGYQLAQMEYDAVALKNAKTNHSKISAVMRIYSSLNTIDHLEDELEQGSIANKIFGDVNSSGSSNQISSRGYELVGYIQEVMDKIVMDITGMTPDRIRQVAEKVQSIQI